MFGWPPSPAHAQSGIDFTVAVASTTATATANTGVPNERVSLELWYRDQRDRIIECGDSGADVEVELTTDAEGTLSYVSTDPAITETYGATGCLTLRGVEHWASSEPLFSISPPFSEMTLRGGVAHPTDHNQLSGRRVEPIHGPSGAGSDYHSRGQYLRRRPGNTLSVRVGQPLAAGSITMTLTPSKTSNVGFTVRRETTPFKRARFDGLATYSGRGSGSDADGLARIRQ